MANDAPLSEPERARVESTAIQSRAWIQCHIIVTPSSTSSPIAWNTQRVR